MANSESEPPPTGVVDNADEIGKASLAANDFLAQVNRLFSSSESNPPPTVAGPSESFERTAKEYFAAAPKDRKPNQTLAWFEKAISAYLAATEASLSKRIDQLRIDLGVAEAKQDEVIARGTGDIDQTIGRIRNDVEQITNSASEAFKLAANADQTSKDVNERAQATEANFKAFEDAMRARGNFQGVMLHWVARARWSSAAFWVSALILLGLLVGVPALALYHSEVVFTFLKALSELAGSEIPEDAGPVHLTIATIGRLVVVTIPLALYFWLIRLVVRFNTRSMLLMDDARQRATMLETYYRMIEKQAATAEERALVLQALFRPAPGHGPDSVEPPNFTEVVSHIQGKTSA